MKTECVVVLGLECDATYDDSGVWGFTGNTALLEAGARSFDIPIWEKLVFHVKNWENEKYDEFPVVTIPCKLHGFFTGAN